LPTHMDHDPSSEIDFLGTSWLGVEGILHHLETLGRGGRTQRGDHWRQSNELWAPHKRDSFGHTALHLAVIADDKELAERILADGKSNLLYTAQTDGGYTPLHLAAGLGLDDLCTLLLNSPAGQTACRVADTNWWTPIWYAVSNGQASNFDQLVGLDDENTGRLYQQKDRLGATLLMVALAECLPLEWIYLILQQSDANARDSEGKTALHYAVKSGKLHNVQFLLSSQGPGVLLALQDPGGRSHLSPLEFALATLGPRDEDIALAFLGRPETVIQPSEQIRLREPNLLFYAISRGCIRSAEELALRGSIDLSATDASAWTAEDAARMKGYDELADLLEDLAGPRRQP